MTGGRPDSARQAPTRSSEPRGLIEDFALLFQAVGLAKRRRLISLGLLMLWGAIAEVAAVVGVLPFLVLLTGEGGSPTILRFLRSLKALGAETYHQQVVGAVLIFIFLTLLSGASRLLLLWVTQTWAFETGNEVAVGVDRRLLSQPYGFHIERNSSTLLAAFEKVHIVSASILLQVVNAATALLAALLIIAALVWIDPVTAALAATGFGGIYLLVSRLAAHRLHRNSEVANSAYEERIKILQESLGGIRDVIIDQSQPVHVEAFAAADRRFVQATGSTIFIAAAPRFVVETTAAIVIAALALFLWSRTGSFPAAMPILGGLAFGGFRLLPYMQQLYFSWTAIAGHRSIISEVVALLALPCEESRSGVGPPPLSCEGGIRFERVSFRYATATRPAVDDISLLIPRGARVALVGRNGSGKSTLMDLAMGLLPPRSGQICVGHLVLGPENVAGWRQSIAHVPQSIFLADDTIARNIALGVREEVLDLDRVERAARMAQLDELLRDLPAGVQTRIGERGIRLSGGQRQRLGLARALYKDAPVLFLDEATSALDEEAERSLVKSLFESSYRRTIVMISHRGSAIDLCDIVVTLDRGRIVSIEDRRSERERREIA